MEGTPLKIFVGQKHANFDLILVKFEVRRRISLERMKIFKIGELLLWQRFLSRYVKQVRWSSV